MSDTGRHSDPIRVSSNTQPRLVLPGLRPVPLCGLLLFTVAVSAWWLGVWPEPAGPDVTLASSAGPWAEGLRGSSANAEAERPDKRCSVAEARDRCELVLRLSAPDGTTITALECSYERFSQAKSPEHDAGSISVPATDHQHWVWMAWALVPIVLACLLLPEPKE